MRKLATVRIVHSLSSIDGADKLELAHIDGWQCVTVKGQFKPRDIGVYFEIDSALPADDPRYEFLHERCLKKWMNAGVLVKEVIRIKTIKLRGVISQGLLMPIAEFPELKDNKIGDDVTEILRVQHYDELAEEYGRLTGKARLAGDAKGSFPVALVPKTDEERLQNLPEYFDGRFAGVNFEVSEKADGTSATYMWAPTARPEDPFFVCSRNLELKDTEGNLYWEIAKKLHIKEKLKALYETSGEQIALQGEIVGPGINGNKDNYTEHQILFFKLYHVDGCRYFTPLGRMQLLRQLELPSVKILEVGPVFDKYKNIEDFLEAVKGKTDRGNEREGCVFKGCGEYSGITFKVINNDYLLKQRED